MTIIKCVDPIRCYQLIIGVLGIYTSYLIAGILHESMIKQKYQNDATGFEEQFTWPVGFLIFPCGITWLIGESVNYYQIKKTQRANILEKKSIICALTIFVSTITYTYAIYLTNFPVVTMFKSCNILSIIMVGALCSKVKDKRMKLGKQKIIVGVLATIGIIMFKAFDPAMAKNQTNTELLGIVLLAASLLADGFLPDFQAQIKQKFSPKPMEMMSQINKWVTIISFAYSCIMFQFIDIFLFLFQHRIFFIHMVLMGVLSTIGQIFVYIMIKQFKQHFAPFVITTRRIFTVGLSIIYYRHQTNIYQLIGIVIVFGIVSFEFVYELMDQKNIVSTPIPPTNQLDFSISNNIEVEAPLRSETTREDSTVDGISQTEIMIDQKILNQDECNNQQNNKDYELKSQSNQSSEAQDQT